MNRLASEDRVAILRLLCEGSSIRLVTRLTNVSKNTVTKLLVDVGKACRTYHDQHVRNIKAKRIQCDEIWSFTYTNARNLKTAKAVPAGARDTWTWVAIDADSKLIVSYLIGARDSSYAFELMNDAADRLVSPVQLTTDAHKAYLESVEGAYGCDVDYTKLVKLFGVAPETALDYDSLEEGIGARKEMIEGGLDIEIGSTPYVERPNLSTHMRSFTRLADFYSKRIEKHAHAVALHFMHYNFIGAHTKLRIPPAMAAGVADRFWEIGDLVKLAEDAEITPTKRGPYKRISNLRMRSPARS